MMSSPLMFESDEETQKLNSTECSTNEQPCNLNNSDTCLRKTEDHKLVERLRIVLTGVPPPPAVTICQFDAKEILCCLNEKYTEFEWTTSKGGMSQIAEKLELATSCEWPSIIDQYWYNISYNRGSLSEELALLTAKYQERFIGNETASSVNSFFTKSPIRTASAKKRARRHAWGHSPGRRLSHLARRRHTFSSANLQQSGGKSLPDKKKMILVERRKSEAQKRSKCTTNVNKCNKLGASLNSSKRALFQSPENANKSQNRKSILSDRSKSSPRNKNVQRSKRALWPDPPCLKPENDKDKENGFNSNGKRIGSAKSSLTPKKRCLKNLFSEDEQKPNERHMPTLVAETLSQLHKQKLLWAVSNALRKEGISMEHNLFKPCINELFKICKEIWLKKCCNEEKIGSTSDRMLELANKFSSNIVRKVRIRLDKSTGLVDNCLVLQSKGNSKESTSQKSGSIGIEVSNSKNSNNKTEIKSSISGCSNKLTNSDFKTETEVHSVLTESVKSQLETNNCKAITLSNSNIICDENAVSLNNDKSEFSPPPTWVNDDTRCSSSCDIDMVGIIESIESD